MSVAFKITRLRMKGWARQLSVLWSRNCEAGWSSAPCQLRLPQHLAKLCYSTVMQTVGSMNTVDKYTSNIIKYHYLHTVYSSDDKTLRHQGYINISRFKFFKDSIICLVDEVLSSIHFWSFALANSEIVRNIFIHSNQQWGRYTKTFRLRQQALY